MHTTLPEMLSWSARRFGTKPFLICADRSLSFAEVDVCASMVSQALASKGIRSGDVVSLWMENGWRWVVAYFGVMRLGAVVNPINILLTTKEVEFITRDCQTMLVIAAADRAGALRSSLTVPILDDRSDFEELLTSPSAHRARQRVTGVQRAADSDSGLTPGATASICYTSGTTGHPKGAVLSHRSIVMNTLMTSLMHGRSATDIVVSALPCPHVYGNVVMNSAVACGMTLVLLARFDEEAVLDAIARNHATMFDGVPTMYLRLLNHAAFERYDLGSLRICTVGGQTMPIVRMKEAERRFGARLLELWGMTELGGLGTTHPHNAPRKLGSIGVPLPFTEARVVSMNDPKQGLERGEIGELQIRGPSVMDGYFKMLQATHETIEPEGWLHTGDLVRQSDDGYLIVVDRKKEVIITGGYNVYPAEVERVIAEHPAVSMVAVAAVYDDMKGQVPKAFIVLRDGHRCTAQSIISHCRQQLASYKTPAEVEFRDDLPKTSTGKVLRRALSVKTDQAQAT